MFDEDGLVIGTQLHVMAWLRVTGPAAARKVDLMWITDVEFGIKGN